MRRFLAFLFLSVLLSAALSPASADDQPAATNMKGSWSDMTLTLKGYEMKINQAFKDKDWTTFQSYVDEGAWSADGAGFAHLSDMQAMMKDTTVQDFTINDYKVLMVDPETYVSMYVWKGTGSYKGQPFPSAPCYCSTVWSKKGSDWKAFYHQETYSMEGTAPAAATSR